MSARLAVVRGNANPNDPAIRGEGSRSSFALRISVEGSAFVLAPEGHLDGEAGEVLVAALAAAQLEADEVVVDLRSVESMTVAGGGAVDSCTQRGASLVS